MRKLILTVILVAAILAANAQLNTLTETVTLVPSKDAFVGKKNSDPNRANTNWGSDINLYALSGTSSGSPTLYRTFMGFDISTIPANAIIVKAELYLYAAGDHGQISGSNKSFLHAINSTWSEGTITWNNQPNHTVLSNDPILPESTVSGSNDINLDYVVDVTSFLQGQLSSGTFEFVLKLDNETGYRKMKFWSRDYSVSAKRPKLIITYTRVYEKLSKIQDGSFIESSGSRINIVHNEDIEPSGNLSYRVLDEFQVPLTSLPTINGLQYGLNYLTIDLSGQTLTTNAFYTIEITSSSGQKTYLKFKKT